MAKVLKLALCLGMKFDVDSRITTVLFQFYLPLKEEFALDQTYLQFDTGLEKNQFLFSNGSHITLGQDLVFESSQGNVESMFYEPYAQSIYMNIPSEKLVKRKQLISNHEDDFLVKGAKHLQMDSDLAKLCWIEYEKSVQCAQLPNIENRSDVFKVETFSESLVSAMSVDSVYHKLYFFIIDVDSTQLFEHDLMSNATMIVETFDKFRPTQLQCLYSKCLWIDSLKEKLVQFDVTGKVSLHGVKSYWGDCIFFCRSGVICLL
jgi:hypothetical protein